MSLPVRPHLMWVQDVWLASKTGAEGAALLGRPGWKERLRLWHDSGESVDSAAEMVRTFVKLARVTDREEKERLSFKKMRRRGVFS